MSHALKDAEPLPTALEIALSYTPQTVRDRLRAFLTLDRRLGQIVAQTNEAMLGQMRLAWWRETLQKQLDERPTGDAALIAVNQHWAGEETVLIQLVDGWEQMLAEPPMSVDNAHIFAAGRAAGFTALVEYASGNEDRSRAIRSAAQCWALMDAATHLPSGEEREMLIDLAKSQENAAALPRDYRGLAVLRALAQRSLTKGGLPLLAGRGAAIVALRAGLLGR